MIISIAPVRLYVHIMYLLWLPTRNQRDKTRRGPRGGLLLLLRRGTLWRPFRVTFGNRSGPRAGSSLIDTVIPCPAGSSWWSTCALNDTRQSRSISNVVVALLARVSPARRRKETRAIYQDAAESSVISRLCYISLNSFPLPRPPLPTYPIIIVAR